MTIKHGFLFVLLTLTAGCATGPPDGVTPVRNFDVEKYLGTWHEIARLDHRFERGLSGVTADYSLNEDGTISVVNRGYDSREKKWSRADGKAKFVGEDSVGSLKVTFFWPFYGGYHIFHLDEDYQSALVAGPSLDYLWVLSRTLVIEESKLNDMIEKADAIGFPVEDLIVVEHPK